MSIKDFGILEAVEIAINIEEEGVEFYTLAAERVDDPGTKDTFQFLREKEYDHINRFRKLYSDLADKRGDVDADLYLLDPELAAYFHAYADSAVFPSRGSAAGVLEKVHDVPEILRLALQIEKDSILFYQDLATHSPFPEASELIKKVIEEERGHFRLIHQLLREASGN